MLPQIPNLNVLKITQKKYKFGAFQIAAKKLLVQWQYLCAQPYFIFEIKVPPADQLSWGIGSNTTQIFSCGTLVTL